MKAETKKRQGARNDLLTSEKNFSEVEQGVKRATIELGVMAGVSASTYEHAVAILDKAPKW